MIFEKYTPKLFNLCLSAITCILCGKKIHILSRRKEKNTKRTDVNNKRENYSVIMSNTVKWKKLPHWPLMPHHNSFINVCTRKQHMLYS
jgi:hypothetical protein